MTFDASLLISSVLAGCSFFALLLLAINFGLHEWVLNALADLLTAYRRVSWISFVRTLGERLIEWADAADERKRHESPCVVIKFEKLTGKR